MHLKPKRRPTPPGTILLSLYLKPRGITQKALADAIGLSRKHVSAIVNDRGRVEPDMAVRLGKTLETSPDVWLNLQHAVDVWEAEKRLASWKPRTVFSFAEQTGAV